MLSAITETPWGTELNISNMTWLHGWAQCLSFHRMVLPSQYKVSIAEYALNNLEAEAHS